MPNAINWSALGTFTTAIAGGATAPTLKNLSSGSNKLGNEIDNATAQDQYADFELKVRLQVAPTAGDVVSLWFVQASDGTNYEDGSDTVTPQKPPDVVFPLRAVTTQQQITRKHILLPATKLKPLIVNDSGQAFTDTDDENVLSYVPYNDEVQ